MIKHWLACVLVLTLTAQAVAAPVTIMVLPIDGDADPAVRTGITAAIEKQARTGDGDIKTGATTFADTAAGVGCDPTTPECAESVRTTLDVDVLVYGTATTKDGVVTVVVRKKEKSTAPAEVTTTLAVTDSPDKVETVVAPLVGKPAPVSCPDHGVPGPDGTCPVAPPKRRARPDRALGIASLIGAGVLAIAGLTQWNEKSKKQETIDATTPMTLVDFQALKQLEDEAGKQALTGNILMLGAVAATAVGVWLIRRDRKAQRDAVMVTPTVTPTGAGVLITIGAQ